MMTNNYMKLGAQQGWQCPVCGNVLSPWTTMCPCHGNPTWTTSTTTDGDKTESVTITMNDLSNSPKANENIHTYYQ